jgi:sugar lactone lactonase YvrE
MTALAHTPQSAITYTWPVRTVLGEGPVYDAREDALYFVDIKGKRLHRLILKSRAQTTWDMPEAIGWVLPRATRPGFIAGFKSGFAALTLDPFSIVPIGTPEPDRTSNRLNDAKVDAHGRIWAGSMDDDEKQSTGALYRLDPTLRWTRMDDGYGVANGPTFSPDGATLYHTDSAQRIVYRFALSPDGAPSGRSVFVRFEDEWGYPDGMTTDSEGGVWIAHWDGARVSRFTPDGKLDRSIALPVSRPTSCVFAGAALDRMFVTSAALGREEEPLAGGLFEIESGARGAPSFAFAG